MKKNHKYPDNGKVEYFYDNGTIELEGERQAGNHIGIWTWWYENGQKQREGQCLDQGSCIGKWTYWHENGQKEKEGIACPGDRRRSEQRGHLGVYPSDVHPCSSRLASAQEFGGDDQATGKKTEIQSHVGGYLGKSFLGWKSLGWFGLVSQDL